MQHNRLKYARARTDWMSKADFQAHGPSCRLVLGWLRSFDLGISSQAQTALCQATGVTPTSAARSTRSFNL